MTPDRSKTESKDSQGVPYSYGNRHSRRMAFSYKKPTSFPIRMSKKFKLPMSLWQFSKSKFVSFRLREDNFENISQLIASR